MGKLIVILALAGLIYVWWRRQAMAAAPMRASEARTLLGVGEGASLDDIRAAHRRLIARVHPDAGGSAGLATRVNAARDALIEELRRR
jgi:DnaJ family protein C protein 19